MARKAEVEESHGQFGCLAIDNLYNIYDLTDRIIPLLILITSGGITYESYCG
jgi:hypothetical protein